MAVLNLLATTPEKDIIDFGNEENKPEFTFPKDSMMGIGGGYSDYSLMECRYAGRKIKDGENVGKVEKYKKWEDINYASSFWGAINNYIKHKALSEFKTKRDLSINDIKQIYLDIQETVCDALKSTVSYSDIKASCSLIDTRQKLLKEIDELKTIKNNMKNMITDIDKMYSEIKDKRKIIVEIDKPKKHKIKEEE